MCVEEGEQKILCVHYYAATLYMGAVYADTLHLPINIEHKCVYVYVYVYVCKCACVVPHLLLLLFFVFNSSV